MDSKNSEIYEDAASKVESNIDDSKNNNMDIKNQNNNYKNENKNNDNVYFKSGEYYDIKLNHNNSEINPTKFDNNEIQKSCCQGNKCNIY
jgi:hypothetical protein